MAGGASELTIDVFASGGVAGDGLWGDGTKGTDVYGDLGELFGAECPGTGHLWFDAVFNQLLEGGLVWGFGEFWLEETWAFATSAVLAVAERALGFEDSAACLRVKNLPGNQSEGEISEPHVWREVYHPGVRYSSL